MKHTLAVWSMLGALLLAFAASSPGVVEASHPPTPQPLLHCSDVNGDAAVAVTDIGKVVSKFGGTDPIAQANATYSPLYDLTTPPGNGSGSGAIAVTDIGVAVSDFGLICPLIDTQIARATADIIDPLYHPPASSGLPDFPGDPALVFENPALLASKGYFRASTDVQGQGIHYVHFSFYGDGLFYPTTPEGLVYHGGRLAAQLYYIEGDDTANDGDPDEGGVGWGCWPGPEPNCGGTPPPDQVDIDAFCTPNPPNSACSWNGSADGWHTHDNLCTVAIGAPQAAAIPGVMSASSCESLHNTWCGGGKCAGTTWSWDPLVGWMGHLWNHMLNRNVNSNDVLGNGRFADCFPDAEHWDGFNCPQ